MNRPLRRVVVVGPESTGKTTLAAFLAARYRTAWAPEFLRAFVDHKPLVRGRPVVERSEMRAIVAGQMLWEDRAARRARGGVVFFDTNPLQSLVYYEHYFKRRRPAWLEAALRRRTYDLYLVLDVDVPWIADGQRDREHFRRGLYRLFRAALEERGLPYRRVFGSWRERRARAVGAVDRLLSSRP
jgi:NadR type nicotinamide-nucleotide adenylyltransferase